MKVNFENYEALIIDYLDGKLDPSVLRDLMVFMDQNPDIKAEFTLLLELGEMEEPSAEKSDFTFLKRPAYPEVKEAFQETLIAFTENDLNHQQLVDFERNRVIYPELNEEIKSYQKAKMVPDPSLVFEGKAQLKKAVAATIIPLYTRWMSIAAIALFLGFGTLIVFRVQQNKSKGVQELSDLKTPLVQPNIKAPVRGLVSTSPKRKSDSPLVHSVNVKSNSVVQNQHVSSESKLETIELSSRPVKSFEIASIAEPQINEVWLKQNLSPSFEQNQASGLAYITPQDWLFGKLKKSLSPESAHLADTLIKGGTKGVEAVALNLLNKTTGISYTQIKTPNGNNAGFAIVSKYFAFERSTGNY